MKLLLKTKQSLNPESTQPPPTVEELESEMEDFLDKLGQTAPDFEHMFGNMFYQSLNPIFFSIQKKVNLLYKKVIQDKPFIKI